jgi:peptidoglycan/LPS O-acetylase OafA/YrhL
MDNKLIANYRGGPMNREFSLYLDLVRFSAAVLVLINHSNDRGLISEVLPQWGHSAVMVFFVLSGYVIAYVTATKENTARDYIVNRMARIYSVAAVAILLTLLLDQTGQMINNDFYSSKTMHDHYLLRMLTSFFFINELWTVSITTYSNVPYWSLNYEVWYYIMFAVVFFLWGSQRVWGLILICVLLGPKILLLAPIWWLGVYLYRSRIFASISEKTGWILFLGSIVGIILFHYYGVEAIGKGWLRAQVGEYIYEQLAYSRSFLSDYLLGIMVFLNFAGFRSISHHFSGILNPPAKAIRVLASYTFILYLAHQPLIWFFTVLIDGDPNGLAFYFQVMLCVIASVYLLGQITEQRKGFYRNISEYLVDQSIRLLRIKPAQREHQPMNKASGEFVITEEQNERFACLSGDFNPLHVDPVYARRLQFGHPVIHGVHHMLRCLDETLGLLPELPAKRLLNVSANFQSPAQIDRVINFDATLAEDGNELQLIARSEDRQILSLSVRLSPASANDTQTNVAYTLPDREQPSDLTFSPDLTGGEVSLFLHRQTAGQLFRHLAVSLPPIQLAQVIASTHIVGMRLPGQHSIFSGLKLQFENNDKHELDTVVRYTPLKFDSRVHLLRIGVESLNFTGELTTFFRPRPVTQPHYATVREHIESGQFSGQTALVVGGSRGVGEVTAKILAAGGAQVTITCNKGRTEAEKVAADITAGGGVCSLIEMNVNALDSWPESLPPPTHIYYFASPHIDANRNANWNAELFERFSTFYLKGFSQLITLCMQRVSSASEVTIFYPSSVYIDAPERGFAEYAVAKAAGEALCLQLNARYKNARFVSPRLPRMATDQTASVIAIQSEPALDVMLAELRQMNVTNSNRVV